MSTVEIKTTQNVTIDYELARLGDRLLAFLLDGVIVFGGYYVLLFLFVSMFELPGPNSEALIQFYFFLFPLLLLILYAYLTEWLLHGQTLGKKSLGIKVVRIDGLEPKQTDYFLRALFLIIDVLTSLGILAILLITSTPRRQRTGDLAANTTVIRVKPNQEVRLQDILSISSLDSYEPTYPEVRQLTDTDMLLVKKALQRYQNFPNEAHRTAIRELVAILEERTGLIPKEQDKLAFLETLIRDYIVLTR